MGPLTPAQILDLAENEFYAVLGSKHVRYPVIRGWAVGTATQDSPQHSYGLVNKWFTDYLCCNKEFGAYRRAPNRERPGRRGLDTGLGGFRRLTRAFGTVRGNGGAEGNRTPDLDIANARIPFHQTSTQGSTDKPLAWTPEKGVDLQAQRG